MVTDDLVSRLRAAEEKMTPGPWIIDVPTDDECQNGAGRYLESVNGEPVAFIRGRIDDAGGIVLLRNLGPGRIADLIEAARERVENCDCDQEWRMVGDDRVRGCVHTDALRSALTAIEETGK